MMPEVFIETPRLVIRQWSAADAEPFIRMNQDADVMEFFPSIKTEAETLAQIERMSSHIEKHNYGFFALQRKDNNRFIGFAGLYNAAFESYFTPCMEIGWRLSKANWNLGFATEAAKACLTYAFEMPGIDEIYSFTAVRNSRSENVMKKIGMLKEGYFEHPLIDEGHTLKQHVLYKINRKY